jgi:glucose/mannose-6-phosphate isomerase
MSACSPVDSLQMDRVLRAFPDQLQQGWNSAARAGARARGCRRVVVAGMGGSALPAELLLGYLRHQCRSALPLEILRDYHLPPGVDDATLVIAASFSGNTEETLAAYEEAGARGARRIALGAGGRLLARAREQGGEWAQLEVPWPGFQPRCALGYLFGALLRLLDNAALVRTDPDLLERSAAFLGARQATLQSEGQRLAERCLHRLVLIYTWAPFAAAVARTFKIKLNENAKVLAFWSELPELNHNEFISLAGSEQTSLILLLEPPGCEPRIQRRFEVLREMLVGRQLPVEHIVLAGTTYLENSLWGILLGDWTSYHLALLLGIDPSPVELIEEFKRRLFEAAART